MRFHSRQALQFLICLSVVLFSHRAFAADEQQPQRKFLRFVDDNNGGGKLQTSIVAYRNAGGKMCSLCHPACRQLAHLAIVRRSPAQ